MTQLLPAADPYGSATLTVGTHALEITITSDAVALSVSVAISNLDDLDWPTVATSVLASLNWYVSLGWEYDRDGCWRAEVRHDVYAAAQR